MSIAKYPLVSIVLVFLCASSVSAAASQCGDPRDSGGVGPFDYRDPSNLRMRRTVEQHHFYALLERQALYGRGDLSLPRIGGDLDYTLRAFPNHHRALFATAVLQHRLREEAKERFAERLRFSRMRTAKCYFERALEFAPGDPNVYNAQAIFMHRVGRLDEALELFQKVVELEPESPEALYNLGLIHFAREEYDASYRAAKKAYEFGYAKPELRVRLQRKGAWR